MYKDEETKKGYDPNVDYEARIQQNTKDGDYVSASKNEQIRNLKIADTGLPYKPTNRFNYQDSTQYERENLLRDIKDYTDKGFSYNPDEDAVYQSLDKRYKQQAEDNYNANITSLAAQYGGDIPAYLKQIAKNNYMTEAGRANDAIPTLSQLAWEKWGDTRNDMYNRYGLLDSKENKNYSKFIDNRNFITGSSENLYNREMTQHQLAENEKNYMGEKILSLMNYYLNQGYGENQATELAKRKYVEIFGGAVPPTVSGAGTPSSVVLGGNGKVIPTTANIVEDEAPGYLTIEDILNMKK